MFSIIFYDIFCPFSLKKVHAILIIYENLLPASILHPTVFGQPSSASPIPLSVNDKCVEFGANLLRNDAGPTSHANHKTHWERGPITGSIYDACDV